METGIETMDKIHIRDLTCQCILGVYGEERNNLRNVVVNIVIYHAPVRSDNIEFAVDYDTVSQKIVSSVRATQFQLIETLAQFIADIVLETSEVLACRVTVDKPGVPAGAESAAAEVLRRQVSSANVGGR